jgi:hypothetical protein
MYEKCLTKDKCLSDNIWQEISIFLMIVTGLSVLFFWDGLYGFDLADEGFLWYGAQRVLAGEVPLRDFASYDIGRYYWSAAFMSLVGDNGVVTLRISTILFQAIALCIGFVALFRNSTKQSLFFWLLTMTTLVVWMIPLYKLFDISLPIILIAVFSFLVKKPSRARYFFAGLAVGLVAVFGRNHGLYGVAGSISVMLYLIIKRENGPNLITGFLFWLLGVVAGYLPVLIFLAVVPGFAPAFWESIRVLLFEIKETNIPLPVPWPWLVPFGKVPLAYAISYVLRGVFFIAILVFGIMGIVWVIKQLLQKKDVSPTVVASIFLALPYAHYAYSRADLIHLALGIPPFFVGIFALLAGQSSKIKWSFAVLLCGCSLFLMLQVHPGWYCYSNKQCVNTKVAGDNLKVNFRTAQNLRMLNNVAQQFIASNGTFICAPFCPGAYAVLGRKSPMWDIYALFPRSAAFQQAEIERIKVANPDVAIIDNSSLDGRNELRFRNTNPIIDQYIRENFERLNDLTENPAIYRSKP